MKKRFVILALVALVSSSAATLSAQADACTILTPPPAVATAVIVFTGGTAVVVAGGEDQCGWTTDGIGHSHEWHSADTTGTSSCSGGDVTIGADADGSVPGISLTFHSTSGVIAGTVGGVPGIPESITSTVGAGAVANCTGVATLVAAYAGV